MSDFSDIVIETQKQPQSYVEILKEDILTESNTESDRSLVSIQIIEDIQKHTNADTLDIATVLGWKIIVKRDTVKQGDKVIFCEIDSLLPVNAFWLPIAVKDRIIRDDVKDFFRVKTIKLRGELSQGLIVPISDIVELIDPDSPESILLNADNLEVGLNITKLLAVKKYEPRAMNGRYAKYNNNGLIGFPHNLVSKTDEPRIQSRPRTLADLQGKPYVMTVKLDGCSATYLLDPKTNKMIVCSRNFARKRPADISTCPYWYIAEKYQIEEKLQQAKDFYIQGEICGPDIQKNLLGLKDIDFFIFNVVNIKTKQRLNISEQIEFCRDILSIKHIPIEEIGPLFNYDNISKILQKAKGNYLGTKTPREGLVIRSKCQSISFKAINNDYLLKHKE